MSVQSVPPLLVMDSGFPVFIPAYPLENGATFGSADSTGIEVRLGKLPLLILSPGQRVDLLNKEHHRLYDEYVTARGKVRTRQIREIAQAAKNVTHELMRRQLAVRS